MLRGHDFTGQGASIMMNLCVTWRVIISIIQERTRNAVCWKGAKALNEILNVHLIRNLSGGNQLPVSDR